jgi:hypothetical protein
MKRTLAILSSLILFLFCVATFSASAQVTARIKGTVTDPVGAVLPNVTVIATNQETGVKTTTTSSAGGDYLFPSLPIGTYTISAASSGFKGFSASGIILNIDQEYVEPVKLTVGNATEQVQVEADAVQVNTTDMQLSNIVNSAQMEELPLIGRNFTGLELTLPGVQASSDRFGTFSVSGSQTQQSEFLINGADTNDIALNTLALTPNLDAIDQFNLLDGPLNAEYDRNSGGIVSATIKTGTNHFHGTGFEYYRDTFLNTLNFFQKPGLTKIPKYHQNIFGGTIGGPILKDKLFFFFAYQGTHQVVPQSGGSTIVYSAADLAGNFSEDLLAAGSNPRGSTIALSTKPIPLNINIPVGCTAGEAWNKCITGLNGNVGTASFNPITSALVKQYVPAPNTGTYGYTFAPVTSTTINQYIGRGDYTLNSKNSFTFLYINNKSNASDTLPFTGATLPGFGDANILAINQGTFDYVHQFNATTVNDFALHYTRFNYQAVTPQHIVQPSSLGFAITPQDAAAASVPTLGVTGFFTLGFSTNGPQPRIDQVYQLDDNINKTFGHHSLKFGYDGRRFNVSNPFFAVNSGDYSFSRSSSSIYSTGDPALDFLLGISSGYAQGTGAVIQADAFLNYVYAQDTWKLSNSFTLDYGLGYSIDTPLENHQYSGEGIACLIPGQQSTVFSTAPKGIIYPGDPGCTNSAQAYTRHTELGPRIGFAWAPDLGWISGSPGKFSIRGGFGIYYDRSEEETALQTLETPPFGLSSGGVADYNSGTSYKPTIANPYADVNSKFVGANKFPFIPPAKGSAPSYGQFEPIGISSYGPSFRAPYAENFQVSIERELPSKMVTRLSYVGSVSRHNQITYEGNYETAAGHASCLATPGCVGDPDDQIVNYPGNSVANNGVIGSVGEVGSGASSNYNSLQASITKAPTHGLSFQISYTYAHALDSASSFENAGFGGSARGYNQFFPQLNYGNSAFDARQRLVFAPIYVTPVITGSTWYSLKSLGLSGWQISGITTVATGFPYDISYGGASPLSLWCSDDYTFYACPDFPSQTGPLARSNPRTRELPSSSYTNWFQNTTFTDEPLGGFGNISRYKYHGPGLNFTNLVIAKNFNLNADGTRRLQLRMESDNVFNHTNFSNPDGNYEDGTFGQITGVSVAARQTQLAARIYF